MSAVEVVDVGPRDGLQHAAAIVPPHARARLVRGLLAAGVPRVEAVSFVRDDAVPPMAGAEQVVAGLDQEERDRCCGLVLNERGYERLLASGLGGVRFAVGVSDQFQRRNAGSSTEAAIAAAARVVKRANRDGLRSGVILATSFGCPFDGEVPAERTLAVARELDECGPHEIVFADTIGVAVPRQVQAVIEPALALRARVGIHVHDTRKTGYVATLVALQCGATIVDASLGGLGGCPFAPGASGNIATEDLAHMLSREGVDTGIDLAALIDLGASLAEYGLTLDSGVQRAGPFPPATDQSRAAAAR